MLSTIKITGSMFPELYDAILRDWDPKRSQNQWQQAFVPRWQCEEEHFGYALADGGRIVGMLGMLFSRRPVAGRQMRFCNLHCWHVKPEYRAKSLALLKPIMELADHTITDFTPSPAVIAISKRLGFKPLDSTVLVLPLVPSNGKSSNAMVHEMLGPDDPHAAQLDPADRQIYHDHQAIDCGHLVARVGHAYCYAVYSRIAQHRLPCSLIHYVSDSQLFAEHHAAIRGHLQRHGKSQFAVVEARHFAGIRVPLAFRVSGREKLYRGRDIAPREIDNLYSEMVLFKHSGLPTLRQRLRTTIKGYIPPAVGRYVGINSSL